MSLLTSCVALNDKEEMRRDAVDSSEGSVLSLGSGHNLYLIVTSKNTASMALSIEPTSNIYKLCIYVCLYTFIVFYIYS